MLAAEAREKGYEVVSCYEELEALSPLLYHRPGLEKAINNIKEEEDRGAYSSHILAASLTMRRLCTSLSTSSTSTTIAWSARREAGRSFFRR
jgi:hypothetical protein